MPIPVKCETCGQKFRANDDASGKIGHCPKCKALIHVPDANWVNEVDFKEPATAVEIIEAQPVIEPDPKPQKPFDYAKWIARIKAITFALCITMFFVSMRTPVLAETISHYVALIIAVAIFSEWVGRLIPERFQKPLLITLPFLTAVVWACFDYKIERWQKTNAAGEVVSYEDYYRRFRGHSLFYRRYGDPDSPGGMEYREGPFSDTGKSHGKWMHVKKVGDLNDAEIEYMQSHGFWSDGSTTFFRVHWYWYGEEITEGEWHLRNK